MPTVLLAEDDKDLLMLYRAAMTHQGLTVIEVSDGASCLRSSSSLILPLTLPSSTLKCLNCHPCAQSNTSAVNLALRKSRLLLSRLTTATKNA